MTVKKSAGTPADLNDGSGKMGRCSGEGGKYCLVVTRIAFVDVRVAEPYFYYFICPARKLILAHWSLVYNSKYSFVFIASILSINDYWFTLSNLRNQ